MTTTSHNQSDSDHWKEWRKHFVQSGREKELDSFHKDGIIDEEKFSKARHRILFVLKEPNHDGGGDLRDWLKDTPGQVGANMHHNLACWSHTLLNNFADGTTYNRSECQESLIQTAVINLKKVAGGATADMGVVGWHARADREMLRKQIRIIKPNIIVAGGTFSLLSRILGIENNNATTAVVSSKFQTWVVPMMHPATRRGYEHTLGELRKQAADCFTVSGELVKC